MKFAAAVSVGVVLLAQATPACAATSRGYWSVAKVMQLLDRTRVRVGARVVRLQRDSLLCSGIGRGIRRDGIRRWRRFDCTQSLFTRSGIYDFEFRVVTRGARRFAIRNSHWIAGSPP
jgi:hypothetical protein